MNKRVKFSGVMDWISDKMIFNNAGFHNSIFRGKNLGTQVTDEQYQAIQGGTFEDLYVGDYWMINDTLYRIAGFDLLINTGGAPNFTAHTICVIRDGYSYTGKMNESNTTDGGYLNSYMRTSGALLQEKNRIISDFGENHIVTYKDFLTSAVTNGTSSSYEAADCDVELMSEVMLYGCRMYGKSPRDNGIFKSQFPLFRFTYYTVNRNYDYWLRDISSESAFSFCNTNGTASSGNASNSYKVRPIFVIR